MVSVAKSEPVIAETLEWGATMPTTESWAGLAGSILAGKAYGGCVLVGRDDLGREALLRGLLDATGPGQERLNISGGHYSQGIDYGALMFLVAGLPDPLVSDPGTILDGFRSQLAGTTASPVILVVERPALLDSRSSMALAQLALRRDIVLIVTCAETTELDDDLSAIWRAGQLAHVEVAPLSLDEAVAHIEERVGGKISRFAATRLWRRCQGSAQELDALVDNYRRSGHLRRLQDSWVVDGGPLPATVPSAAHDVGRVLTPRASRLLTSLLENGQLGMDAVVATAQVDALDEIFQAGLGRYSSHVGVIEPTDTARHHLSAPGTSRVPLRTGAAGHQALVASAWAALDHGNARGALRILENVPLPGTARGRVSMEVLIAAVETRAEAELLLGNAEAAVAALSESLRAVETAPSAVKRSHLDRLHLALARIGARCGDHDLVTALAGTARDAQTWLEDTIAMEESTRLSMAACLAESWILDDRQEQGRQLNVWVIGQLTAARSAGTIRSRVRRRDLMSIGASVLTAALLAGDWQTCREWMLIADRLSGVAPETALLTAIAEGLIAHNAGDTQYAVEVLMPVLRQLQHGGRRRLAEIASSIIACCLAELGRRTEAQALLAEGVYPVDGTAGMWMAEFHAALSIARLHSPTAGANRLGALADTARDNGSRLLEAHALAMAMLMGKADLDTRLSNCAADLDGPLADAFRSLARGHAEGATRTTATALESLILHGFRCYGDGGLVGTMPSLNVADKRRLHRAVGDLNRRQPEILPRTRARQELHAAELEGPYGESLTSREREVANLVRHGLSNIQVSHRTGVSVRTVEGHLYQVYSKLQVKGRRDLMRLGVADTETAGAR